MCATQSAGIKRTVRAQSPWRKNMLPNYAQASTAEWYKDNTARPSNSTEATANPSVGRRKLLCLLANLLSVICEVVGEYQVRFRLCWALVIGGIQELLQTRKNRSTAQHTTLWHRHSNSGGWHRADVHAQCDTIEETMHDCVRAMAAHTGGFARFCRSCQPRNGSGKSLWLWKSAQLLPPKQRGGCLQG